MTTKTDGGPAFPGDYDIVLVDPSDKHPPQKIAARQSGMSLRDYFAAKAMQGLAANPKAWDMTEEMVAVWAYKAANAMLKARGEK